ncbi:MAG: Radical SAM superfamily protein [Pelotomaculum sp. PtaB.Bin013]|uniref:4Fe-4S cluster-binding domain-containing protein n=1 Tax=Pelotomaculum isophthalicicum JI TaxID=947010 RepID=A0A9X4H660_9FIRM|nr:radical SAM protein [Pelotomaculum isophthalicicum]MDF9408648.1 4Fe-4S cluster-binding domain-containing protein [Pelotomaculum isophthalicicum JI]OPX91246.1 MAG: Radical SAM superfamily protein [Pelotomaculum sp. PtaB.Bin013]
MVKGSYLKLPPGELAKRAKKAVAMLGDCTVCAQECRVNRLEGELGICRGGRLAAVNSYGPHFGEEDVLVGTGGSGTIFFTYCNLSCEFCQNCEISQLGEGDEVPAGELAGMMLDLQKRGCHNINLVSPSHFVPQFLEALNVAAEKGLTLPVVYNTGGYDAPETLDLLDGIVDIYMPDIKFADDDAGRKYSGAVEYFTVAKKAVKKMHGQVDDLAVDGRGIAYRGLLVRHLVLPDNLARSEKVFEFLADEVSKDTFINIMDQYYPAFNAVNYPELDRRITRKEFREAVDAARRAGLRRIYTGFNKIF